MPNLRKCASITAIIIVNRLDTMTAEHQYVLQMFIYLFFRHIFFDTFDNFLSCQ